MDFFAAEARAKKRTSRLKVLFVFAVAGTIAAGYAGTILLLHATHRSPYGRYAYGSTEDPNPIQLWQPGVFAGVSAITLGVIGLAALFKWNELSGGGAAVAENMGGRRIDPHTKDPHEHQLLNVVEEMAIASGLPVPAVYVIDDEAGLNSFAAGLTSSDAVVTVTRGALQRLSRDELQGVVGHEFSHILNGDMRMNMRVTAIIFGILVIGIVGRATLWGMQNTRVSSREKGGGAVVVLAIGVGLLVIGYVGYFFGRLIQASLSRQREFLADASSVQFTRNPAGVTGALKKIGGMAIGSNLDTHKAAEIGHFFFAQAFESNFGGLWATHPPLVTRIRAIEPAFDGKFPEPPEVVDVSKEPWSKIPGMPPGAAAPSPQAALAFAAALTAAAGTLTPASQENARTILGDIPAVLRTAARSPHDAPFLVYGLLLDGNEGVRRRQTASIAASNGSDALHTLQLLDTALRQLGPENRLALLQLAIPSLKALEPTALGTFAGTLDDLVQLNGNVTTFEFALQRIVLRELAVNRDPKASLVQIYSFQAVVPEIAVVLSSLAHASSADAAEASKAFAEGTSQLKLIEAQLHMLPDAESGLVQLDAALDKLGSASGPIKQRLLVAAAHVVGADGVILASEAELMRAIAASLGVPVPPLTLSSAA